MTDTKRDEHLQAVRILKQATHNLNILARINSESWDVLAREMADEIKRLYADEAMTAPKQ